MCSVCIMWLLEKYQVLFVIVLISRLLSCDAITNASFNSNIREYSEIDHSNISSVKTLHKEDLGRHSNFAPAGKLIKFKEIPDSALSSSSNGRGLLYHEQPGYGLIDYEDSPHYGYEYQLHDSGHHDIHAPHGYDHHDHHDPGHHHYSAHHHLEHGHHKHYNHALAAKSILWPIAGIALLGAAAALVSNPILLQLGVVSGRRKRRDTEEVSGPDFLPDTFKKYAARIKKDKETIQDEPTKDLKNDANVVKRMLKRDVRKDVTLMMLNRVSTPPNVIHVNKIKNTKTRKYSEDNDDDRFLPIPLKLRDPV